MKVLLKNRKAPGVYLLSSKGRELQSKNSLICSKSQSFVFVQAVDKSTLIELFDEAVFVFGKTFIFLDWRVARCDQRVAEKLKRFEPSF
jgi:hypothetical protein